jgi:chemotaxis-related protein WspD
MTAITGMRATDCWKHIGIWGDRTCSELPAHLHCRNCTVYSAGAALLLDAEVSADELARRAQHYATPKIEERVGTQAIVVFRLGAEWFSLPAAVWCEVASPRPIHSLPHRRDKVVTGVVNVRGELLVCVSLTTALGAEPGPKGVAPRFAVIQRASDRFVFPADEIVGLHRYGVEEITPTPATLAHAQAACTHGMLTLENRSVGVLDADRVFQILNRSLA